jgi:hypothetical protein
LDLVIIVVRKYIDRNRTHADDGQKKAELGKRLEIEDSIDAQDRSITFSKYERPPTVTDATHAMVKELTNTVQDTGQYIQDVKTHMDRQMSTINKIKAQKEEFDKELKLLQFGNQQQEADPSIIEMNKIRDELVEKKKLGEASLARLSNHAMVAKKQVDQYQSLIDEVDGKLRKAQHQTPKLTDDDRQLIAKVLSSTMGKTQDAEVIRALNQIASNLEQSD